MTKEENEKRLEHLKNIVLSLPEKPGSYQYYDEEEHHHICRQGKEPKKRVLPIFIKR